MSSDQNQPPIGPESKTFEDGLREGRRLEQKFHAHVDLHWVPADDPHNAIHQKALVPELCFYRGGKTCSVCKGRIEVVHAGAGAFVLCKLPFPARNPLEIHGVGCAEQENNPLTSMV
jgi:hypothetical protein